MIKVSILIEPAISILFWTPMYLCQMSILL